MTIVGKPRGSYAKTAARRRQILEAAFVVFATQGFRGGSIQEVADRVGMSQTGLLHHFSSKNELLTAVLQFRDDRATERFEGTTAPGLARILAMVELADYNASVRGLVQLYCVLSAEATSPEHPAHDYFRRRYEFVRQYITDAFVVMEEAGQLVEGTDPAGLARGLVGMMDGLQVQWLLHPDKVDMGQELRRYLRPVLTVEI